MRGTGSGPSRGRRVSGMMALVLAAVGVTSTPAQDAPPPDLGEALSLRKAWLKDPDATVRRNALRELGEAQRAQTTAPSRELAEVVAKALKDKDLGVRVEAARQLGNGLHLGVAAEALPAALKQARREVTGLRKDAGKGSPNVGTVQGEDGVRRPSGPAGDVQLLVEALLVGLGRVPDDRSVQALLAFAGAAKEDQVARHVTLCAQALLSCGDRKSVEGVLDLMNDLEKELLRREAQGEDTTAAQGENTSVSSSMRGGEVFRQQFPAPHRGTHSTMQRDLREFATKHELPAVPEEGDRKAWQQWFDQVAERLPAKVGKVIVED